MPPRLDGAVRKSDRTCVRLARGAGVCDRRVGEARWIVRKCVAKPVALRHGVGPRGERFVRRLDEKSPLGHGVVQRRLPPGEFPGGSGGWLAHGKHRLYRLTRTKSTVCCIGTIRENPF